jgi:CRISPR-associated endonuclease/helicase Cas3
MSPKNIYAHTPSKNASHRWDMLQEHLIETAKPAYVFAKAFRCGNAAFGLGLFHDLGKVNPAFQAYLEVCKEGKKIESVPHAVCGASYLWKILLRQNSRNAFMAMSALGHHSGLSAEHMAATKAGKLDQWWNDVQNK